MGSCDGLILGVAVGFTVGEIDVVISTGSKVGRKVGLKVGNVLDSDELKDGELVGLNDGKVGSVVVSVGSRLG